MLRKRQPKARAAGEQAADPAAALATAATLLARRDFCTIELGAKLLARGFGPDAVRSALAQLIERRYLDDQRYARRFVELRADRGQGPRRIRRELAELGLPAQLIEAQLAAHGEWARLAREVLTGRFGRSPPRSWPDKARRLRFLQYRGFSIDDIRSALGPEANADVETELEGDLDPDN
ncbi:MAG: regulatory protein RecX [Steroidobacterales bacterium]